MNRIWAAAALFLLLLGLSIWGVFGTAAVSEKAVRQVERMEQAIEAQDYPAALSLRDDIQQQWERDTPLLSSYLNHAYLEVVDAELASLAVRLAHREESFALAHCSQLKEALWKIREMEIPRLENLL